ncbi:hypothetical protein PC111_g16190 [Phytophthora cactorum]|nr:hypothetical protein PC111_g16190 [Phytophthora cactorum]
MEWRFSSGVGLTTIATRYIHHRQGGLSVSANDGVVALKLVQLPAGGLTRSIITRSAAKALLSVSKNVHCAQMKKLAWSIRQRCPTMQERHAQEDSAVCVSCLKKPSACRIHKKLHFMMADRKMLEQEVAFCPRCYMEALDAKTVTVASQELLFNDVYGWNEVCAYTSGTEISVFDDLN